MAVDQAQSGGFGEYEFMTKKVGFIGNCQLGTLSGLYRRLLGEESGVEVFYVAAYQSATDEQKQSIESADIIVRQILDFSQKIGSLTTNGVELLFPQISGAFLWPYTGQAHPRNQAFPFFDPSGPYPAELGDLFLNNLIAKGVAPEEAVIRYLETDVAATKHLDRLLEVSLEKQRARDTACGYAFADFIEARFRSEPLFRSPNHFETSLTMAAASQLFERLELDADIIAKAVANPPGGLFPISATPIHPAVVKAFGLSYIGPDQRYRYFEEGSYTFEEYVGRYMRFDWNPKLAEGLHWYRNKDMEKALDALELGVLDSPRSAVGRFVLAELLVKSKRLAEGIYRAREAMELEPANPHYRERHAYFQSLRKTLTASPLPAPMIEAPVIPTATSNSDPNLAIEFGLSGNAKKFLVEGWSAPEMAHTWTVGHRASIRIGNKATGSGYILTFAISPFTPQARPYQRFSVVLNEVTLAELYVDKASELSVWIPADVVPEGSEEFLIHFELPDAAKPADFDPGATDSRALGLAFKRLSLERLVTEA